MQDKHEKDQKVEKFRLKVLELNPLLQSFPMEEKDWGVLYDNLKDKTCTTMIILRAIGKMKGKTYDQMVSTLASYRVKKTRQNEESSPKDGESQQKDKENELPSYSIVERKNPPEILEKAIEQNTLKVIATPTQPKERLDALKKWGVTVVDPTEVTMTSLHLGDSPVPITPKGSQLRPVFGMDNKHILWGPATPYNPPKLSTEEAKKKLPASMSLDYDKKVSFTVTRETVTQEKQLRRPSQKTLKGGSASSVFAAHYDNFSLKEGEFVHWSHTRGLTLQGDQAENNLYPSTGAANWNVLDLLEAPIKKMLTTNSRIKEIQVEAELKQADDALIPEKVIYRLKWTDQGKTNTQHFVFYPQSHQRASIAMRKAIESLKSEKEESPPLTPKIK